jgi:hypothetical protein
MTDKERNSGINRLTFYQQLAIRFYGRKYEAIEPKYVNGLGEIYSIAHNDHPDFGEDIYQDMKIIGKMTHPDLLPGMPPAGAKVKYFAGYDDDLICLFASLKMDKWAFGKTEPHFGLLLWTTRKDCEPWGVDFSHQVSNLISTHLQENILAYEDSFESCSIEFDGEFLEVSVKEVFAMKALESKDEEAA